VLEANPRGLLLPRIYLTPPDWWAKANPDECQVLSHGGKHYRQGIGHGRDGKAFPSLASLQWRADTADALRHAWSDPRAEFEKVKVPSQAAREAGRNQRTFRDPATEMAVIDWYLFYNDLVPDTMEVFLGAAKEASDFRKVVGAFYCYMFEFGGDPEYGHNALDRLLRSKHLDFAIVTASYHNRALGRGADYARAPITSVGLHGKLWYHDNDTVSFRYDEIHRASQDRATVERYRKELGVTGTAQETIWQYRRGAGFVLRNGIYQSFFDLHGGYFDAPELMAEVTRLNALLDEAKQDDCSSVAEILVVSEEVSCGYATFESGFLQQTLQPAQVQLAKLGAPHDSILVDDLARAEMKRYKLVIFLNCFHLTDRQRELIRRTVLWCYAPGLFNGPKASVEAMHELTHIRLVPGKAGERLRLRMSLNAAGSALLAGVAAASKIIGHEHVWGQWFSVEDPQAIALGHVEGHGEVALAMKRLKDWNSIYTLNPVLPVSLLRALARQAGIHIYNDRDDTLYASRSYLCLNADGAGERTLRWPSPARLFDPFTGRTLTQQTTEFTHRFADRETLLIRHGR